MGKSAQERLAEHQLEQIQQRQHNVREAEADSKRSGQDRAPGEKIPNVDPDWCG